MPGKLRDHPDRNAVLGVRADECVEDEHLLVLEETFHLFEHPIELLLRERPVDLPPPDALVGDGVADDELVVCGAAGVLAGGDDERSAEGDPSLSPAHRLLEEYGSGQVPVRLLHTDGTDLVLRLGHFAPLRSSAGRWK